MPTLWQRLQKRKMAQWAVAYLAGAWLVLQVLDVLAQPFAWPDLIMRVTAVFLAVGFLGALVIAWYHGEKGRQRVTSVELMMLAGILVIAAAAVAFVRSRSAGAEDVGRGPVAAAAVDANSIAVLPFVNMSADPENEYFSDGITEEILNVLTGVEGLRVAARTSAFAFKGRNADIREVGQQLNVANVLEGSVRKAGDRLRITAQLISVGDGYHVWSETYDRELRDVFAIQDEIARAIVGALEVRLAGRADEALVRPGTDDLEAYESYLRGRFFWNRRTLEGVRQAAQDFQHAIQRDSTFAMAWAGLADSYALFSTYAVSAPDEAFPQARVAALRALELDPELAEPHAALGFIKTHYEWDWAGAEDAFGMALERRPGYATAHQWLRLPLTAQARFEEAIAAAELALQLDPLSLIVNVASGTPYHYARRWEEAESRYRRTIELDPSFVRAHSELGDVLFHTGRIEEAMEEHRLAVELSGGAPRYLARLGYVYARTGRISEAREIVAALTADGVGRIYVSPYLVATALMGLDDVEAALTWLRRAADERDAWAIYMAVDPVFDSLTADARFRSILKSMGL